MQRVRVFVDFWNFQLQWNDRTHKAGCDWSALPAVLLDAARQTLPGLSDLQFIELRVYASVSPEPSGDSKLRSWLDSSLNRFPGFHVLVRPRVPKTIRLQCKRCQTITTACSCGAAFSKFEEKGIDTAIATDLLGLAWESAFDIAILVSSDADFIPAVEMIHRKGLRVINASWHGVGHELAKKCWASVPLDTLILALRREETASAVGETDEVETIAFFVAEVDRAHRYFANKGGFLGASHFINKWISPGLPPVGEARRQFLGRAQAEGWVEVYKTASGASAIRPKAKP